MTHSLRMLAAIGIIAAWAACLDAAENGSAASQPARSQQVKTLNLKGVLATCRAEHPRLIVTRESLAALSRQIDRDEPLRKIYEAKVKEADGYLKQPTAVFDMQGPEGILMVSRKVKARVQCLSLVYLFGGDKKYADRAIQEMETAAAFETWNPKHFLDVAEMSCAFALGLDWLHDAMTADQRDKLRAALVQLGLKPGLEAYKANAHWAKGSANWNFVCNNGLTMAALAIAEDEPELAAQIVEYGLKSVPNALVSFDAEGGWMEGPGYWQYSVSQLSFYLASLDTALGSTGGLETKFPGLAKTGQFPIYCTGPTRQTFNFADAGAGAYHDMPELYLLAKLFNEPVYSWFAQQVRGTGIYDLIWYYPQTKDPVAAGWPLDKVFPGAGAIIFRGAWMDDNAMWIGVKAGDNATPHSHLDLGEFVMESQGVRWMHDLGSDSYFLPGYWDTKGKRWSYYRLNSTGHNTLTINGKLQKFDGKAAIAAFDSDKAGGSTVLDLSDAYPDAKSVLRGVAMLDRRQMLVQDEIHADQPVQVTWAAHTTAKVQLSGDKATLEEKSKLAHLQIVGAAAKLDVEEKGKLLHLRIVEPAGAKFEVQDVSKPGDPNRENPGVTKLLINLPAAKDVRLVVLMTPEKADDGQAKIVPLAQWKGWK